MSKMITSPILGIKAGKVSKLDDKGNVIKVPGFIILLFGNDIVEGRVLTITNAQFAEVSKLNGLSGASPAQLTSFAGMLMRGMVTVNLTPRVKGDPVMDKGVAVLGADKKPRLYSKSYNDTDIVMFEEAANKALVVANLVKEVAADVALSANGGMPSTADFIAEEDIIG